MVLLIAFFEAGGLGEDPIEGGILFDLGNVGGEGAGGDKPEERQGTVDEDVAPSVTRTG